MGHIFNPVTNYLLLGIPQLGGPTDRPTAGEKLARDDGVWKVSRSQSGRRTPRAASVDISKKGHGSKKKWPAAARAE